MYYQESQELYKDILYSIKKERTYKHTRAIKRECVCICVVVCNDLFPQQGRRNYQETQAFEHPLLSTSPRVIRGIITVNIIYKGLLGFFVRVIINIISIIIIIRVIRVISRVISVIIPGDPIP